MQLKDLLRTVEISDMRFTTVEQTKTFSDYEIDVNNIEYEFSKENDAIWSDALHAEIISIAGDLIVFDNIDCEELRLFVTRFEK